MKKKLLISLGAFSITVASCSIFVLAESQKAESLLLSQNVEALAATETVSSYAKQYCKKNKTETCNWTSSNGKAAGTQPGYVLK